MEELLLLLLQILKEFARYTSNGVLDTNFNTTGIVTLPNASGNGTYYHIIEDLAVKSNGKISAIGWINQQGLSWSANHYGCRLNSNGNIRYNIFNRWSNCN